jgi:ATP-dependent Clp protease ATP-binding subunit ClpC
MKYDYAKSFQESINAAGEIAKEQGNSRTTEEHILIALIDRQDGIASEILKSGTSALKKLKKELLALCRQSKQSDPAQGGKFFSSQCREILEAAKRWAEDFGANTTCGEHFIFAVLENTESAAGQILKQNGMDFDKARQKYHELKEKTGKLLNEANEEASQLVSAGSASSSEKEGKKKPLETYCRNLTEMARKKELDPVIGRDAEIERCIQILQRKRKNNPILLGEAGVGKSAVIEGLALRFASQTAPDWQRTKRIFVLDLARVVAGTKFRGQFEERITGIIREVEKDPDIILAIDEFQNLIGAGAAEGSLDASSIMKEPLSRGRIRVIGSTTSEEFRKYVEKDAALSRRFQPVKVSEPSEEMALQILQGLKDTYENHHSVTYSAEALEVAVKLSARYIKDRQLPDKAIDVIDEAGARAHIAASQKPEDIVQLEKRIADLQQRIKTLCADNSYEQAKDLSSERNELVEELSSQKQAWDARLEQKTDLITEEDIAEIVSDISGVPVSRMTASDKVRFLEMADVLPKRLVGQEKAREAVLKAVKRGQIGLREPNRPIGSFVFLGPTGTGKTELAKLLAELFYADPQAFIRLDMSEYQEKVSVSKLTGTAPGYVGYDDAGPFEKVRKNPHSVVLFDEIEKAHRDVMLVLLQILDEGHLTIAKNIRVDFQNTIIIMTSNLGSNQLKSRPLGFGTGDESGDWVEKEKRVIDTFKKAFPPEFVNRIDEILVFTPLSKEACRMIIDIELAKKNKKMLSERNIELVITENMRGKLLEDGFNQEYGGRPIKRALTRLVIDPLADHLLDTIEDSGKEKKILSADYSNDSTVFTQVVAQ